MGNVLKVEGYEHLVRNDSTNAIVNISRSEYKMYMSRFRERERHADEIRSAVKEINILKIELREIKKLIKGKLI
jgi:hypothetical protein